jgi:hypothetical protein
MTVHVGDTTLFLGDLADPSAAAAEINMWETSGSLTAVGGEVLRDVRLGAVAVRKAGMP